MKDPHCTSCIAAVSVRFTAEEIKKSERASQVVRLGCAKN